MINTHTHIKQKHTCIKPHRTASIIKYLSVAVRARNTNTRCCVWMYTQ